MIRYFEMEYSLLTLCTLQMYMYIFVLRRKMNGSLSLLLCLLVLISFWSMSGSPRLGGYSSLIVSGTPAINKQTPLVAPETRDQISEILQGYNFSRGAELGVQTGVYSEHMLNIWTSCRKYYLVDIWAAQENYKDIANVGNDAQENLYQDTKKRLERFSDKTEFMRMKTVEAARLVPDASLDFIYVDARHDYCGVKEDIEHWWPKLRPGGIMAGHDYMNAGAQALKDTNQDWSVCDDGSVHPGAVKGAVDEFALNNGLTVAVTYREPNWPSWLVVKPSALKLRS